MPLPERELIARIRRASKTRGGAVRAGIGDDSAVLRPPGGHELLLTTDFSLEGVHFRRQWHPPESVGHRCLARGLSDIAAMGGHPLAAFLSLALPAELPQRWADRFFAGLLALADEFSVTLAGGDVAQSPAGVLADIVVVGSAPTGKAVLRSGARPGDLVYLSGELGASVAALEELRTGKKPSPRARPRHFYPLPRIEMGEALRGKASAMIDTSDGLSTDLGHICEESRVAAWIYPDSVPRARGASLDFALHGGEDYELLFTAPAKRRIPSIVGGVHISLIGEIVRGQGVFLVDQKGRRTPLPPRGWQHFDRSR